MASNVDSKRNFGELNFGPAELGDKRRTKRLVNLADQMMRHPGGTLPHKLRNPSDLVALYRLCRCEKVTHAAVLAPHRQATLGQIQQRPEDVLILHDSTEIDYCRNSQIAAHGVTDSVRLWLSVF